MKTFLLLSTILLASITALLAQSVDVYTATVVTMNGYRTQGVLLEVNADNLFIDEYTDNPQSLNEIIPLSNVRKVVLRRASHRRATVRGAIVGGVVTGLISIQTSRRNTTRSPIIYGITLAGSLAVGALTGALAGNAVRPLFKKTIRPRVRTNPDETIRNLRRELEPYTFVYQQTILNRVNAQPQP